MYKICLRKPDDFLNLMESRIKKIIQLELAALKEAQQTEQEKKLLTREEACQLLRISKSTLHRLVRNGHLPCKKVGRTSLYTREDLQKLIITYNIKTIVS